MAWRREAIGPERSSPESSNINQGVPIWNEVQELRFPKVMLDDSIGFLVHPMRLEIACVEVSMNARHSNSAQPRLLNPHRSSGRGTSREVLRGHSSAVTDR